MVSHSAISKMKAIFIIDVLIVAAAAGIYLYFQDQGEFTTIALTPATFAVTDLSINPTEANVGQAILVSVNVTNIGDEAGSYSLGPEINGVVSENKTVELNARESTTVEFAVVKTSEGTYTVKFGDLTGTFKIVSAPANGGPSSGGKPASITGYNLVINPAEVWPGDNVKFSAQFTNYGDVTGHSVVSLRIAGAVKDSQEIEIAGGGTKTVEATYTAESVGTFTVNFGTLSGTLYVVPSGTHTLTVKIIPAGDADFFLDGAPHKTPYSAILSVGTHTISLPMTDPTGKIVFLNWEDYSKNPTRTINLQSRMTVIAYYSGGSSCPSLYVWNGTDYVYIQEVSNHGWLGYTRYVNGDGSLEYWRNNPWDYIPLGKNQLQATGGYYNLSLTQNWDEIFFIDAAYLMVVDHPSDTNVYSTMVEQYIDPNYMGQIYTVSKNPLKPISATNELITVYNGVVVNSYNKVDALSAISSVDEVYTSGFNGKYSQDWNNQTWNRLTVDLGNLTGAPQIKLVVKAMTDWGPADSYVLWMNKFYSTQVPNHTEPTPVPFMEVKDANGNWVRVPENRQFPLPPDLPPQETPGRTFVVDLTGLFPTNDYSIRINNFWNVTFDYIGIDTTASQNVTIRRIDPQAYLYQKFATPSNSSGNFTRYGNVTELLLTEDDKFVIGRQGDSVSLQFPTENLTAVAPGMERDFLVFVANWFKVEYANYGFGPGNDGFTVDPLPFHYMSGFPYPLTTESYPYDAEHLSYLQEYNTRMITRP